MKYTTRIFFSEVSDKTEAQIKADQLISAATTIEAGSGIEAGGGIEAGSDFEAAAASNGKDENVDEFPNHDEAHSDGVDPLMMIQVKQNFERKFGVNFNQFFVRFCCTG